MQVSQASVDGGLGAEISASTLTKNVEDGCFLFSFEQLGSCAGGTRMTGL